MLRTETPQGILEIPDSERTRCEVWTRVMGYHRPVSEFNPGKKAEHAERTHFIQPPTCCPVRAAG